MNVTELKMRLRAHPDHNVSILRPDGSAIPAHYHLTEVGYVAKNFVDCGGTFRTSETCVLQTHFGSTRDDGHRLTAGKFALILDLAKPILPTEDLPVEVEYEAGVISQAPLAGISIENGELQLQLGSKHTDCLAKEKCGSDDGCGCAGEPEPVEAEACCATAAAGQRCC
jgi:hypothetical protein